MKHLLITAITLPAFVFGGMHMAGAQTANTNVAPPPATEIGKSKQTATVDDINIPYEIIFYIEEKYPGHAVTQAAKVTHDGKEAFRLRIDRDDVSSDYEGYYLLFSTKWALVSEQKITEPPTPKEAPKSEVRTSPSPKPQPKPEQPAPQGNGGGRGSGGNPSQETVVQPQSTNTTPSEPVTEEDPNETSGETEPAVSTSQAT